jgi:hypothetical protein
MAACRAYSVGRGVWSPKFLYIHYPHDREIHLHGNGLFVDDGNDFRQVTGAEEASQVLIHIAQHPASPVGGGPQLIRRLVPDGLELHAHEAHVPGDEEDVGLRRSFFFDLGGVLMECDSVLGWLRVDFTIKRTPIPGWPIGRPWGSHPQDEFRLSLDIID